MTEAHSNNVVPMPPTNRWDALKPAPPAGNTAHILSMPANPNERTKRRQAGEQMIEDKARQLVYQRAIVQWNQPPGPLEMWLNRFYALVAVAGCGAMVYFIWNQVAEWAR